MPVDLSALPDKLPPVRRPRLGRWCLFIAASSLLVGFLVVMFWRGDGLGTSLWFWSCAALLPMMMGMLLLALRLLLHEQRVDYVETWNSSHTDQEALRIKQGQRAVALLATSYSCGGGDRKIAAALHAGHKPLQSLMWSGLDSSMRLNPLDPEQISRSRKAYTQHLIERLGRVCTAIEDEVSRYVQHTPLWVRIRHDQVLDDDAVLSIWRQCGRLASLSDQVVFATQEDGVLWLDAWLDEAEPAPLCLSVEFNLFEKPVEGQVESVSVLLLALGEWAQQAHASPSALIHRPVQWTDKSIALEHALLWGKASEASEGFFIWHSQLSVERFSALQTALSASGRSPGADHWHQLNESLGYPACAVGNLTLIVASEQSAAEQQAQLVMLQDDSLQLFVVQPS